MAENIDQNVERKAAEWRDALKMAGQTHTARLMRGASRLAADLDTDAATAAMVLGACLEIEGACEGRR